VFRAVAQPHDHALRRKRIGIGIAIVEQCDPGGEGMSRRSGQRVAAELGDIELASRQTLATAKSLQSNA
jgi:hypothetical protein